MICGLARAQFGDIDRCWEAVKHAAQPRIHTFIGTSPLHRAIPNLTMDEMAERIHETVTHARNLCDNVQWSPMDATRTEAGLPVPRGRNRDQGGGDHDQHPRHRRLYRAARKRRLIRKLLENVPGADEIIFATHCHNDLGMATANSLAAVEAGARQIECTINGLGERAGNTALEEVVMAMKVRNDIMPYQTGIDSTKIMNISRRVAAVSGFAVQFNKAIVGKNAFAHESGIHQDGMLKNAETFEIMRPEDVGLTETNIVMGKHSGRAALRSKLENLGFELGDNQLKDVFVRFKELADRKKEIYDDDLIALMRTATDPESDRIKLKSMHVVCGTEGPNRPMTLNVDGSEHSTEQTGDGPVDASFKCDQSLGRSQRPPATVSGARRHRRHRCAGDRVRPAGRRRAHRDRPVRQHGYSRRFSPPIFTRSTVCWCAAKEAAPTNAKSAIKTLVDKIRQGFDPAFFF